MDDSLMLIGYQSQCYKSILGENDLAKVKYVLTFLTLRGDGEVTSPYNINTLSSKWVMRILKLIT